MFAKSFGNRRSEIWCKLHEEAFAYFGGVTLGRFAWTISKKAYIKPDIYDPELNRLYAAMLAHNGDVALPCRPYAPDLKGKVESAVGYTSKDGAEGQALREHRGAEHAPAALERALGNDAHSRHQQAASASNVRRGAAALIAACRPRVLSTIASASAPCTSTAISKSTAPTTPFAPPRWPQGRPCTSVGYGYASSTPRRSESLREHAIATRQRAAPNDRGRSPKANTDQGAQHLAARIAASSGQAANFARAVEERARRTSARSSACSIWRADTVRRRSSAPVLSRRTGQIWRLRFLTHVSRPARHTAPKSRLTHHKIIPEIETIPRCTSLFSLKEHRHDQLMNSIDHCANSGSAVWPIRCTFASQQARAENSDHSIFIGLLVHDEFNRRRDRLVERRLKPPAFVIDKTLDTFDWKFKRRSIEHSSTS